MDLLVRHPEEFAERYSCAYKNESDWAMEGNPNILLGFIYILIGTAFIALYALCTAVMLQKKIRANSCLKIMIQIGVMDMANLLVNCVYTGYLTMTGAVYCSAPIMQYLAGCYIFYVWTNSSITSVILSIDRACELLFPHNMDLIFGGYRIYLWLGLPHLYSLGFAWFTSSPSYSTKKYAWFFDPYVGIEGIPVDHDSYENIPHIFHNLGVAGTFTCVYIVHFTTLWWKTRDSTSAAMSKTRKNLLIQSMSICTLNFSACVCYVVIERFPAPKFIMMVTHALWVGCNCGPVIIYLTLNKTIQQEFKKTFLRKNVVSSIVKGSQTFN